MSENTSRLVVQNLQKSFKKRQVVKSFSLEIESGEVIGLLGPNGAGKTTSFYMIVGLIAADAGSVTLDGQELRHLPIHERARLGVGYLPQEASIFRKMTVEQNIRAILEISTKDKSRIDGEVEKLLADLNIGHLRHNPAPSLSGGERRRVEIARVLAMQPRFILLDEPFAGVDPIAVIDIQKSSTSSNRVASAYSLPTTTYAKPSVSATEPTSSATAPSSPPASRTTWSTTNKSAPSISAKTSNTDFKY